VRVIAGTARGRTLLGPPAGAATRPTSDKVREAIFNVLGDVSDLRVLDLFAGTGAFGIEALSRGAARAVFVESDRKLCETIKKNLGTVGLADRATVLQRDVRRAGSHAAARGPFELVFADPPYGHGLDAEAIAMLVRDKLLAPSALVVVEHASRDRVAVPAEAAAVLTVEETRIYGDTALTCYRAPGASSDPPP
jgi:16S rRNA (guanine(966)-N(2))-methyltransferase RsmD